MKKGTSKYLKCWRHFCMVSKHAAWRDRNREIHEYFTNDETNFCDCSRNDTCFSVLGTSYCNCDTGDIVQRNDTMKISKKVIILRFFILFFYFFLSLNIWFCITGNKCFAKCSVLGVFHIFHILKVSLPGKIGNRNLKYKINNNEKSW